MLCVYNKSWPKGSIAKVYLAYECLTFCFWYLYGTETKFNCQERNYDRDARVISSLSIFCELGQPFRKLIMQQLSNDFFKCGYYLHPSQLWRCWIIC